MVWVLPSVWVAMELPHQLLLQEKQTVLEGICEFSARLGDANLSSSTVVCIPEQPAETLRSAV